MNQHAHLHPFTTQLDEEWQHLRQHRRSIATVRSWGKYVEEDIATTFAAVGDLEELVALTQRSSSLLGDRLLLAMIDHAQHDQLAGRIVVQRLLPGLISAAVKYRFQSDDDPAEVAVGALWIAIQQYDATGRTRHPASSLISDAIFAAFRQSPRRRGAAEQPTEPTSFDYRVKASSPHAFEELATVVADARRAGVPTYDLDLLRHLVKAGSPGIVARQRDITSRTVRNHRDRAAKRVRLAVAA
jgi:hypothetical protein